MDTTEIQIKIIADITRQLGDLKSEDLNEIGAVLSEFTEHAALGARIKFLAKAKEMIEHLERNY